MCWFSHLNFDIVFKGINSGFELEIVIRSLIKFSLIVRQNAIFY
jgi:hypothetical protein